MILIRKIIFLFLILAFFGCESNLQNASDQLDTLIHNYQDHEGYDDGVFLLVFANQAYQFLSAWHCRLLQP